MIRISMLCLLAGFALGAALLINKAYPVWPAIWSLLPVHIELLIFGWIIQLTLGTAYWILPKLQQETPRGNRHTAVAMVVALNLGIVINIGSHLFYLGEHAMLIGRLLELTAVLLFITLHWQRILTFNK